MKAIISLGLLYRTKIDSAAVLAFYLTPGIPDGTNECGSDTCRELPSQAPGPASFSLMNGTWDHTSDAVCTRAPFNKGKGRQATSQTCVFGILNVRHCCLRSLFLPSQRVILLLFRYTACLFYLYPAAPPFVHLGPPSSLFDHCGRSKIVYSVETHHRETRLANSTVGFGNQPDIVLPLRTRSLDSVFLYPPFLR